MTAGYVHALPLFGHRVPIEATTARCAVEDAEAQADPAGINLPCARAKVAGPLSLIESCCGSEVMMWTDVAPYAKELGGPLIGFIFGGLLTSYVQWGFEKKKQILLRRRELVTGWRMNLLPLAEGREVLWTGDRKSKLLSSPYYASLRPQLPADAIQKLERDHLKLVVHLDKSKPSNDWAYHFPLNLLVEEIGRIEKQWKLV